eukprot:995929-Prorocentrum_minimum.AAC.1
MSARFSLVFYPVEGAEVAAATNQTQEAWAYSRDGPISSSTESCCEMSTRFSLVFYPVEGAKLAAATNQLLGTLAR